MTETRGTYRDEFASKAEALKEMEKEIANEGKFSIQLTKNTKEEDAIPLFEDAIKNNIKPEDIIFYSIATGVLKYSHYDTDKLNQIGYYRFENPANSDIHLTVRWRKKESHPATIFGLSTKAEVEAKNKKSENLSKENQKRQLIGSMDMFEKQIQYTKGLIDKGVDKELEKTYFAELEKLKTSLKLLLDTIDDKLETAKK